MEALKTGSAIPVVGGSVTWYSLRVGALAGGREVRLPVIVAAGEEDGPRLLVTSCLHGDEVLGSDVVRRVVAGLDPRQLRGTVVAFPWVNAPAVATRTRRNVSELYPGPHDMNRVFPGASAGVLSERIARLLSDEFISGSGYVFDFHCASVGGEWVGYSAMPANGASYSQGVVTAARGLASAFQGPMLLDADTATHGSIMDAALKMGIPASMAEFGVANVIDAAGLALGMRGLRNILCHLEMVNGEVEPVASQIVVRRVHRMIANEGGYLIHEGNLGRRVRAGERLSKIESIEGLTVEEIVSPADGVVCRRNTNGVIGTGDLVVYVGEVER